MEDERKLTESPKFRHNTDWIYGSPRNRQDVVNSFNCVKLDEPLSEVKYLPDSHLQTPRILPTISEDLFSQRLEPDN